MSDMDREGQTHASCPATSKNLALKQLEAAFEATLAEALRVEARLTDLHQTWLHRKRLPPRDLRVTPADATFDLCNEDEVGSYYSSRDLPALHEVAKVTPHLWHRVQSIATAVHRYQQDNTRLADEIGLTAAHQEWTTHVQALHKAGDAILREPATCMAVLIAKARVVAWSMELKLDQDPWSVGPLDDRAMLVLVQDLINASPALMASA